jgi:hypothetical protein
MAAAREARPTFHADGSVTLGGRDARPDEVEILGDAAARARRSPATRAWSSSSTRS